MSHRYLITYPVQNGTHYLQHCTIINPLRDLLPSKEMMRTIIFPVVAVRNLAVTHSHNLYIELTKISAILPSQYA